MPCFEGRPAARHRHDRAAGHRVCGPAGIYAAGGPSGAFRDMVKEFPAAPDAVAAPFFCSGSGTVVKEVPNS
jgi:hypothetical protein